MSVYTGESRGELLAWLNDLLAPQQITKLEQCGSGSVYCQVIDSIFGDLPMSRVKFNARHEYEYLENFKILQKAFQRHRIDKPIPVDKLVKCKMQDNLEFLQWMKKYWDVNSPGIAYDAPGRAGGIVPSQPATTSRAPAPTARTNARAPISAAPRTISAAGSAKVAELNSQIEQMTELAQNMEKERNFYFDKLRNIELIIQDRLTVEGMEAGEKETLTKIQEILYSTVEGFELPNQDELEGEEFPANGADPDEEETF